MESSASFEDPPNEEVLKPWFRDLFTSYLLERREFDPGWDRAGEVRQHPAAARQQSRARKAD